MAERARANCLGDPDADLPGSWEPQPPFAARGVHAMLMVWADHPDELAGRLVEFHRLAAEAGGVTTVGEQDLQAIDDDREHFGFRDGISQPAIAGDGGDDPDPIAAGEFLLGHPDELGLTPTLTPAELGHNGTFAVYRKLRQDVVAFRAVLGTATRSGWRPSSWVAGPAAPRSPAPTRPSTPAHRPRRPGSTPSTTARTRSATSAHAGRTCDAPARGTATGSSGDAGSSAAGCPTAHRCLPGLPTTVRTAG